MRLVGVGNGACCVAFEAVVVVVVVAVLARVSGVCAVFVRAAPFVLRPASSMGLAFKSARRKWKRELETKVKRGKRGLARLDA